MPTILATIQNTTPPSLDVDQTQNAIHIVWKTTIHI